MRPVLLLDVRSGIFFVGPPSGKLDLPVLAVAIEMVVNELGAIVGVDASQSKGEGTAHVFYGVGYPLFAFAHHGARFHPGGVDVGHVEGVEEFPAGTVAGVRDQIDFGEAGGGEVPAVGLDGNVMLE